MNLAQVAIKLSRKLGETPGRIHSGGICSVLDERLAELFPTIIPYNKVVITRFENVEFCPPNRVDLEIEVTLPCELSPAIGQTIDERFGVLKDLLVSADSQLKNQTIRFICRVTPCTIVTLGP